MGKLVTDMGGAAMIANVILGEELGLYRAMADSTPITPEALATKTGCNPRLIREWLHAQAAAGYVEQVEGQFRLPPEQALALAVEDSPVYVAGGAVVLASLFLDKDKLTPDRIYFIDRDGRTAATATAMIRPPATGYVHIAGVTPHPPEVLIIAHDQARSRATARARFNCGSLAGGRVPT